VRHRGTDPDTCAGAAHAVTIVRVCDRIDVVVVAFNHYELTSSCLRHLHAQTLEHRVILVDNGSTDDTLTRANEEWPQVRVERFEQNRSFPVACNRGVAAGSGEIVVLLNNDVNCRPDFLEHLTQPCADPTVGSVASLMLQPDEESIDSLGITADVTLAGFQRLHGMPRGRARDDRPLLTGAEGTAGAYRRSAWEQVNGMDETIPAYMESFDLALRLRMARWRTACAPEAIGVHLGSKTFGFRSRVQRRLAGFSRGYLLRRYGVLRTRVAPRALLTEAIVVTGDVVMSRDLAALGGRVTGWRAGRGHERRPWPPPEAIDADIAFWDSLALRRGAYTAAPPSRRPLALVSPPLHRGRKTVG
jgi:N-acetylglucosaminyl-diphospho-decaprenol L-rhamnosyltransferase